MLLCELIVGDGQILGHFSKFGSFANFRFGAIAERANGNCDLNYMENMTSLIHNHSGTCQDPSKIFTCALFATAIRCHGKITKEIHVVDIKLSQNMGKRAVGHCLGLNLHSYWLLLSAYICSSL